MEAKYYIENCNNRIYYELTKTKRKTIGIIVDKNGKVKVHAPSYVSDRQIREVVQKKADWIIKKVNEIAEKNLNSVYRQFVNGEKFLFLGKECTLEIAEKDLGKPEVLLKGDTIVVYISRELSVESRRQTIKEVLIKWYRQRFAEIVKERIEKHSVRLKAAPRKVVVKDQKTIWGSCSKKGNINLNWRLIMAPLHVIDYVVVHELCHLKFMNHSKDFWNLVESIQPSCYENRKWLKANGHRLEI